MICGELARVITRHISSYVATSCVQSLGENCSKSSPRHVHDIHGEISVGFCDPLRVYTTLVRVLRYV